MSGFLHIFIIAVSLALDAFSVSVAGGIKAQSAQMKDALRIGLYFGGFQAGMPLLGWLLASFIQELPTHTSNLIAFVILCALGLKMIKEALATAEERQRVDILGAKTLFFLAVATSIDALIIGVTLGLLGMPIVLSAAIIGIVTFVLSVLGFIFGKKLGVFFAGKVELIGGVALIAIGIKILFA